MKKGILVSLSVMFVVLLSLLVISLVGVHCELWYQVALKGSRKIGFRLLRRAVKNIDLTNLSISRLIS